jgi:AcrR family transcriptional regulator
MEAVVEHYLPRRVQRPRTQDERSRTTQQRLIKAAIQLLARKGYAGFRVDEVARTAKTSRGAQTHHFPTKDTLVFAALESIFRASREQSERRVQALKAADDVIAAMLADGEDFFFGPDFTVALDVLNLSKLGGKFRQQLQVMARENRLAVEAAWYGALVARGIPRPLAEEILWLSYSVIRGLMVRRLIQDDARIRKVMRQWYKVAQAMVLNRECAL